MPSTEKSGVEEKAIISTIEGSASAGNPHVLGTPSISEIFTRFSELCSELNLQTPQRDSAWNNFEEVAVNYTLEGEPLQWLACALFVACRGVPSADDDSYDVDRDGDDHDSPTPRHYHLPLHLLLKCVSSTHDEFGPAQFFAKMKRWMEMSPVPVHFRREQQDLEKMFAVSKIVYAKFSVIFETVFQAAPEVEEEPPTESAAEPDVPSVRRETRTYGKRNRNEEEEKSNAILSPPTSDAAVLSSVTEETEANEVGTPTVARRLSVDEIRRFAWTLLAHVKSTFPAIAGDLVNSYHLMLCVVDFIFHNLLTDRRRDLLNPNFPGVPPSLNRPSGVFSSRPSLAPVSIVETLCHLHGGTPIEAKGVKIHYLTPFLNKMFEKMTMRGKPLTQSEVLSSDNFSFNYGVLNTFHDEYVMLKGDFEERIFLDKNSKADLELSLLSEASMAACSKKLFLVNGMDYLDGKEDDSPAKNVPPQTPLSNRHLLHNKPSAGQNLDRLKSLLAGSKIEALPLTETVLTCSKSPEADVLRSMFMSRLSSLSESVMIGMDRFEVGEIHKCIYHTLTHALYYNCLEKILEAEQKRLNRDASELGPMMEQDNFHRCLFACCLEIVVFCILTKTSDTKFPLVLQLCEIPAYHFYRVIELVVRTEGRLWREVVKHLTYIEETVLESLAWAPSSSLWASLDEYCADTKTNAAPSCAEVTSSKAQAREELESGQISEGTRRRLFEEEDEEENPPPGGKKVTINIQSLKNDKPVVVPAQVFMVPSSDGQSYSIRLAGKVKRPIKEPKSHSSLSLFYRKVYHMSALRLKDLVVRLGLDEETQEKTWSLFHHTLRADRSIMMRGRHLDQILLSSLYVVCKLTGLGKEGNGCTFQQIMRGYRMQPQFRSHVYRSVLLNHDQDENRKERRGDLITFYNEVFLPASGSEAMKISNDDVEEKSTNLPSLHPLNIPGTRSPRRLTPRHSIFVSPRRFSGCPPTDGRKLSYQFSKSPAKDLRAINIMIRRGEQKLRSALVRKPKSLVSDFSSSAEGGDSDKDIFGNSQSKIPKMSSLIESNDSLEDLSSLTTRSLGPVAETQFEIVLDDNEINGHDISINGEVEPDTSDHLYTGANLRQFVTLNNDGDEIRFVTANNDDGPRGTPSLTQPHFTAAGESEKQILRYVSEVDGQPAIQCTEETVEENRLLEQISEADDGFTTYVLQEAVDGTEEIGDMGHVIGDNVAILTDDGLVMNGSDDGETYYQLITADDGLPMVTTVAK